MMLCWAVQNCNLLGGTVDQRCPFLFFTKFLPKLWTTPSNLCLLAGVISANDVPPAWATGVGLLEQQLQTAWHAVY